DKYAGDMKLNDLVVQATLWVFGSYEVVRTLAKKIGSNPTFLDDTLRQRVKAVRDDFERVRIPLAKFEAPRKRPNDRGTAYPAIHQERGIGWSVAKGVFFSRRGLSDKLLKLLTAIDEHRAAAEMKKARRSGP